MFATYCIELLLTMIPGESTEHCPSNAMDVLGGEGIASDSMEVLGKERRLAPKLGQDSS